MIVTTQLCGRCCSDQVRKNGSNSGRAKYQCKACAYQSYVHPAAPAAPAARGGAQVEKLLAERNSQRSIVRVTGVARTIVAKLAKKAQQASPPLPRLRPKKAQRRVWKALEFDEMRTFVGRKNRKVWLWWAVERASRRIVAWVLGRRDAATADGCGRPCRGATAAIAGTSPTYFPPTWACCRAGNTAAAPKEAAAPASSKPLIIPYASEAAYSCESPVPSAKNS